jgi:hypothetical protein
VSAIAHDLADEVALLNLRTCLWFMDPSPGRRRPAELDSTDVAGVSL